MKRLIFTILIAVATVSMLRAQEPTSLEAIPSSRLQDSLYATPGSDDRPCHRGTSGPDVLRRSERLVRIDADLGLPGTSETTIPADETENRP